MSFTALVPCTISWHFIHKRLLKLTCAWINGLSYIPPPPKPLLLYVQPSHHYMCCWITSGKNKITFSGMQDISSMKIALNICYMSKNRHSPCPAVNVLINCNTSVWSKGLCDPSSLFSLTTPTPLPFSLAHTHKDALCSLQVLTCK